MSEHNDEGGVNLSGDDNDGDASVGTMSNVNAGTDTVGDMGDGDTDMADIGGMDNQGKESLDHVKPLSDNVPYGRILIQFMSYLHGTEKQYSIEHKFAEDELRAVTPDDIVLWFTMRVFGKPDPGPDDKQLNVGFRTLHFSKKAMSFFMPDKDDPWDPEKKKGNPTKSKEVNNFIKKVRQLEGASKLKEKKQKRKARVETNLIPKKKKYNESRAKLCEMMEIQYTQFMQFQQQFSQMHYHTSLAIGQMNSNLAMHSKMLQYALAKVQVQPQAPHQKSADRDSQNVDAVDSLAQNESVGSKKRATTKVSFTTKQVVSETDGHSENEMDCVEDANQIEDVDNVDNTNFDDTDTPHDADNIYGADNDASLHVDADSPLSSLTTLQELWKEFEVGLNGKRSAKDFTEEEQEMAGPLYNQRNVFWTLMQQLLSSTRYTSDEAITMIYAVYGEKTPLVEILRRLELDAPKYPDGINPNLQVSSLLRKKTIPELTNPGEAVLTMSGKIKTLRDLWEEYDVGLHGKKAARDFTPKERGKCKTIYCRRKKFWDVMIKMMELGYSADGAIAKIHAHYGRALAVSNIISGLANDAKKYPEVGLHPDLNTPCTVEEENMALEKKNQKATLARKMKSLRDLWDEYDVGLDGSIPARDFSAGERGACKTIYSHRKIFWDLMEQMLALGFSVDGAITRIKEVYGRNITVSPLLQQLRNDRKVYPEGVHPKLLAPYSAEEENEAISNAMREGRLTKIRDMESLRELWDEYTIGIHGFAAAKDFNRKEKTRCQEIYNRRMVFWSLIEQMIEFGFSADGAIARVEEVYNSRGDRTVQSIVYQLRQDKKKNLYDGGIHPHLTTP